MCEEGLKKGEDQCAAHCCRWSLSVMARRSCLLLTFSAQYRFRIPAGATSPAC